MERSLVFTLCVSVLQYPWPRFVTGMGIGCTKWRKRREKACVHVYGEMFAHIYNQAFVFAVIHSATESTLPVVVQHQQSEPPTPKPTHVLTYTHSHTHTHTPRHWWWRQNNHFSFPLMVPSYIQFPSAFLIPVQLELIHIHIDAHTHT